MSNRNIEPKRTQSPEAFLRQARIGAVAAIAVLAGAVVWDLLDDAFWSRHAVITSIVASLLVVAVSAAVFNELLERRDRRRWSVLAQYVMLDLVRISRVIWTGLLDLASLTQPGADAVTALSEGAALMSERPALRAGVAALLADPERRERLQQVTNGASRGCNEVLGRWASVMLAAAAYTEILDRHVELYGRIAWLDGLLGHYEPLPDDNRRRRRFSTAHPAVELQQNYDDDVLCSMIVAVIVLAESLDRTTLQIAGRLVPIDWWTARAGDTGATTGDD